MNNFSIDKKDLEEIEAILRNNRNIENIYKKLCTLELDNKKDTTEYSKLLNYLSIVIEVEDTLYKKANLTVEKTLSWLKFLNKSKEPNSTILIRITNYLFQNLIKNYNALLNLSNKEITNILDMSGIKLISNSEEKEEIFKCIFIKETIQQDIYYIFLSFLQEHINNPKEKMFRKELIITKYNSLFINKKIEIYPLKNNLEMPNNPYIIFPLIRKIKEINEKNCHNIVNQLCDKIATNEIYELLEINNLDYGNISKASSSIIRQCMLTSTLILMDDKNINEVNYKFHEYIEDKEYELVHPNNNISKNIIVNIFKNIQKDKNKIKILSL